MSAALIPTESNGAVSVAQVRALMAALPLPDVKKIRDSMEALLHQHRDTHDKREMAQDAAEVKLWAERRLGQLLRTMPKNEGGLLRGDTLPPRDTTPTLAEYGISKKESSRYQAIESLEEKVFEQQMAEARQAGDVATSATCLKIARTLRRKRERNAALEAAAAAARPSNAWKILHADLLAPHGLYHAVPNGMAAMAGSHTPGFICESPALIFADPPYNVGVDYGEGTQADSLPDEQYLRWVERWLGLCHDRLIPDGTMWLLIGDEYADHFGILLARVGFHRRAWVKWYETFGVCNSSGGNFSRCSRHLFYCVKNPRSFVWHPEPVTRPSDRQAKYNDARADPDGKVWDDVWQIPRLTGTCTERLPDFPTQLPVDLLTPIIAATSHPGDLVVDPFCGSGTTGIAALRLGRRFLGLEKSEAFVQLARLRLRGEGNG